MARRLFAVGRLAHSPLIASTVLFACIVALRFSSNSARGGILLLLVGPIVIVSLAYQPLVAGIGTATAALLAYVISQHVGGGGLIELGTVTRAFTYYAIPLAIWLARTDAERHAPGGATETAGASPVPRNKSLTPREREVLGLVAAGHTNTEIAEMLVLSVRTVESHRASLRRKLGSPSRPELVRHARRSGVLPGENAVPDTDGVARENPSNPGPGLLSSRIQ